MLATVVMAIGALVALLAAYLQARHNDVVAARAFDELAERTVEQIRARMLRYDAGLHGLRGAVLAAGGRSLRNEQLQAYADSRDMRREFPGARGFGVIWRSHNQERKVISFIEPAASNQNAFGLDIASEPSRNAAAVASSRSGEATLTAPITLVQATGQQKRGLLLMLPIYQTRARLETPADRDDATIGWTYAPLVIDDVLNGLEGEGQRFHLQLFTPADPSGRSQQFYGNALMQAREEQLPMAERSVDVQGQRWDARLIATPEFIASLNPTEPRRVAVTIGMLSVLLSAVAFLLAVGRARSQRESLEVARRAAIVEGSQDAIIGATLDGVITEWNSSAERLFGYPAHHALGRSVEELLLPADRQAEDEFVRATIASGHRLQPFETLRRHQDGSLIAVALTAGPILDDKGQCVGMAKTLRDVREAQRARAELDELNASLEAQVASRTAALVTALRDNTALLQTLNRFAIVAVTDPSGLIREVNEPFCRISGYESQELVGGTHH
ncbi:PAS domain S-box protein, partial [Ostertagia ostertagi]